MTDTDKEIKRGNKDRHADRHKMKRKKAGDRQAHRQTTPNRLAGLVVKASASGAEDPGFESRLRRDFPGESYL